VNIDFALPIVLDQQLLISKLALIDPLIYVARDKEAQFTLEKPKPDVSASIPSIPAPSPAPAESPASVSHKKSFIQGLYVHHLKIDNGKIQYIDQSLSKDYHIRLEDLVLKASEVSYPLKSVKSTFRFMVVIKGEEIAFSGSKIMGDGWVNFGQKDMNGKLEAELGSQPSGEKWLQVNLVSKNNDMTVEGKVDINQIINTNHDEQNVSLQDFVFGALQSSGLKVGLGFMFKTKMDAFKVDSASYFGDVRQEEGSANNKALSENLKKIGEQIESSMDNKGEEKPQDNVNAVAPPGDAVNTPAVNGTIPAESAPSTVPQAPLAQ